MSTNVEIQRLRRTYLERDASRTVCERYSCFDDASLFIYQSRERAVLRELKRAGLQDLSSLKVLDIGCGYGDLLRRLISYGARPSTLYGIDLLSNRLQEAKSLSPNIGFIGASADLLPFSDAQFDLVIQFTMLTSVLDEELRRRVAVEVGRVLRPGGSILWFDMRVNNPWNHSVRGISKTEIRKLFPNYDVRLKPAVLAPPLLRALAGTSWLLCILLSKVPWMCTHYLGLIQKRLESTENTSRRKVKL